MKLKLLFVFMLICVLALQDADAWFGGRRRRRFKIRFKPIARLICSVSCKFKVCKYVRWHHIWRRVCHKACRRVCRHIFGKKREEIAALPFEDLPGKDVFIEHPSKLSLYDADNDGRISRDEFRGVFKPQPALMDEGSFQMVWDEMDKNSDGFLNCDEFLDAKIDFGDINPSC